MKHTQLIAACAAAFLCVSPVALRAESGSPSLGKLVDAGKLDGRDVKNLQGQDLGKIKQVLIDPQSGRVRYGVLQVDKAWSLNNPEIAVPFGAFKITRTANNDFTIQLDATKEKLEKAPQHKIGEADRLFSVEASQPLYTYWSIMWLDDPSANSGSGTASTTSQTKSNSSESSKNASTASSNTSKSNQGGSSTSTSSGKSSSSGNVSTLGTSSSSQPTTSSSDSSKTSSTSTPPSSSSGSTAGAGGTGNVKGGPANGTTVQ
jgi:sporulation protein YlmC with PRC-barrel domain